VVALFFGQIIEPKFKSSSRGQHLLAPGISSALSHVYGPLLRIYCAVKPVAANPRKQGASALAGFLTPPTFCMRNTLLCSPLIPFGHPAITRA